MSRGTEAGSQSTTERISPVAAKDVDQVEGVRDSIPVAVWSLISVSDAQHQQSALGSHDDNPHRCMYRLEDTSTQTDSTLR